ncbi:MAG: VOC family protein [Sphingomonas sp.]|uniref:VOC family protein n=1 Tax=Sphingomonas sp. TaxID=28214 RepID=UPI001AC2F5FA|nr:VOC family protein [Sphingomonas sp.]MBN8808111.1 VOC family protein [Sphingomonas sp.]
MPNPHGTPIWYELMTPDVEAAKQFYGDIVGWNFTQFPSPDGGMQYTIGNVGETGVVGLTTGPDGSPKGWWTYFYVTDVDAKVAEVEGAGGKTHMPATDMPGVGRMAFVEDPQGVMFYLMRPDSAMGDRESTAFSPTLPGRCSWNELVTTDQKAALPFYQSLLGWTSTEVMSMGEHGDYTFLDCGDARLGAMMDRMSPEQPVKWTFYFHVADVDAAVDTVKAAGGQVIMGPMDVPGGQRIIIVVDPQGASVGFVSGERQ